METYNFKLNFDYITLDSTLCEEMKSIIDSSSEVLIEAPQGVGKTTFIEKILGDECYVISPTRALANQINNHDKYQDLANTFMQGYEKIKNHSHEYRYIIFDECHYLVNYCSFAIGQVMEFYKIYTLCRQLHMKIIFISATTQNLYCLSDIFYNNIDCKIKIEADRQYVNKVYVYEDLSQDILSHVLLANHSDGYMQVVLCNDSSRIRKISSELKKKGLKVAAISSNDRNTEENKPIFRSLTHNRFIALDILLVTSWADVGINFINDNIRHIYYECGKSYERGSLISLMQWIARPRKCQPDLHMVKPILSSYDRELLCSAASKANIDEDILINDLIENGLNSKYYPYLVDIRMIRYKRMVDSMNEYKVDRSIGNDSKYFIHSGNHYEINDVLIKNEVHMMLDRLILQNMNNLERYFNYSKMIDVDYQKLGPLLVTNPQKQSICHLFDVMAKTGYESKTQEPIKKMISYITGYSCNHQLSNIINAVADELEIELQERKSHGSKFYCIKYADKYNPIDYYSGELASFLELEVDVDYDVYDGIALPYEVGYHLKDGYTAESIVNQC